MHVVCVFCETTRPVTKQGRVRKHKCQGRSCTGSGQAADGFPRGPEPFKLTKNSSRLVE